MEFRLPALGEGIDAATVVGVLVKPGDAVTAGQNVLAVETDKAAVDVPIEFAGTIAEISVKPGDKIPVGGLILTMKNGSPASGGRPPPASADTPKPEAGGSRFPPADVVFKLPALGEGIDAATVVGVLVKIGDTVAANQNVLAVETDKAAVDVPVEVAGTVTAINVKPGDKIPVGADVLVLKASGERKPPDSAPQKSAPITQTPAPVRKETGGLRPPLAKGNDFTPAGPATRRLARELGVALTEVKGSARGGRVTLEDLKSFIREERQRAKQGGVAPGKTVADSFAHPPLPDFTKYGEVEVKPASALRKKIAENLTVVARTVPAVTQHDAADITDVEAGRKKLVDGLPKGSPKITWTVLAVKACVAALKEFPQFNSSYDMNAGELIVKKYFNIGIAVDTERGLVVPVVKNADKKSLKDIAAEIAALAEKARAGKLAIDDMRGGTFTITNLGGIGGTGFTPIVNYPEAAILGLSKSALQPVVRDGKIVPRLMMPLSLSYDHRVIDGADGCRFTARLATIFSESKLLTES